MRALRAFVRVQAAGLQSFDLLKITQLAGEEAAASCEFS
jgi:hypothetical protein